MPQLINLILSLFKRKPKQFSEDRIKEQIIESFSVPPAQLTSYDDVKYIANQLDETMKLPEEEFEKQFPFPHCDSRILHSPGTCIYCDKYPTRQQYRVESNTNFSNENDPSKLPCPSTYTRPPEIRDKWYGNTPQPYGETEDGEVDPGL